MACDIMVVRISARREMSPEVQEVLSRFGCCIRVRLGLHDASSACSDEGLLVLQLSGEHSEMQGLEDALNSLSSVKAKMVSLDG